MKHIFVINPKAGKINRFEEISKELLAYDVKIEYEIYETKSKGDGRTFVHNYLETHDSNETYRFYAIGGDGSLHDVVNGAFGFDNAEVACYASGSGNDFIKNFGNGPEFRSLDALIKGKSQKIDLLQVDEKVCINIFNYGFDGEVTFAMHRFKRWPLVTGKMAYNLGALSSMLFKMSTPLKVTIDGALEFDEKGLLIAVANGHTYGGGFRCAPLSKVDDGIIDVCLVKKVSRFKAPALMAIYKRGDHISSKKLEDKVIYKKCKEVTIESPKPVAYAIDGETFRDNKIHIKMLHLALNFVVPEPATQVA